MAVHPVDEGDTAALIMGNREMMCTTMYGRLTRIRPYCYIGHNEQLPYMINICLSVPVCTASQRRSHVWSAWNNLQYDNNELNIRGIP